MLASERVNDACKILKYATEASPTRITTIDRPFPELVASSSQLISEPP